MENSAYEVSKQLLDNIIDLVEEHIVGSDSTCNRATVQDTVAQSVANDAVVIPTHETEQVTVIQSADNNAVEAEQERTNETEQVTVDSSTVVELTKETEKETTNDTVAQSVDNDDVEAEHETTNETEQETIDNDAIVEATIKKEQVTTNKTEQVTTNTIEQGTVTECVDNNTVVEPTNEIKQETTNKTEQETVPQSVDNNDVVALTNETKQETTNETEQENVAQSVDNNSDVGVTNETEQETVDNDHVVEPINETEQVDQSVDNFAVETEQETVAECVDNDAVDGLANEIEDEPTNEIEQETVAQSVDNDAVVVGLANETEEEPTNDTVAQSINNDAVIAATNETEQESVVQSEPVACLDSNGFDTHATNSSQALSQWCENEVDCILDSVFMILDSNESSESTLEDEYQFSDESSETYETASNPSDSYCDEKLMNNGETTSFSEASLNGELLDDPAVDKAVDVDASKTSVPDNPLNQDVLQDDELNLSKSLDDVEPIINNDNEVDNVSVINVETNTLADAHIQHETCGSQMINKMQSEVVPPGKTDDSCQDINMQCELLVNEILNVIQVKTPEVNVQPQVIEEDSNQSKSSPSSLDQTQTVEETAEVEAVTESMFVPYTLDVCSVCKNNMREMALTMKGYKLFASKQRDKEFALKWGLKAPNTGSSIPSYNHTDQHTPYKNGSFDNLTTDATPEVLKKALRDMENKYNEAMVQTAQLDNEKTQLHYQTQKLLDSLEEQEDDFYRLKKKHKEKCQELEKQKRGFDVLRRKCNDLQDALRQRDELIEEQGLIFIGNNSESTVEHDGQGDATELMNAPTIDSKVSILTEENRQLLEQVQNLKLMLEEVRASVTEKDSNDLNSSLGATEMQLLEIQREANKQVNEYKFKLQKSEQDLAVFHGNISRLESQLIRYKQTSETYEKNEDEMRAEKRKLMRDLRTALDRIEEVEMTNSHLEKRLERLRASRTALSGPS
uniref:uncharacterized protein LOC100175136 isoform X3 n=1 Tax=Ciona intestinalis TaxID=7719 RepID=UPI00089DAE90|nr:uncharacterized protein LOC100175136 isoform X3 [Ciona intestinalis]|eukprot:XP_018668841.1 uncharacterized protein LOC100175136 isoform X3 [Ciona intestinalis]